MTMIKPPNAKACLVFFSLLCSVATTFLVARASSTTEVNIFPGLDKTIQRLRFHTGRIVDNRAEISSILPDIPGSASNWVVTQWSSSEVLSADKMRMNDNKTIDRYLGNAIFSFTALDNNSHVWIYRDPTTSEVVYELYERNGFLTSGGGTNLFLSSDTKPGGIALNHVIRYRLEAKLPTALVSAPRTSQDSGAVLASVFTGFVIQFPDPPSGSTSTVFLQLPIASSRSITADYRICSVSGDHRVITFSGLQPGDPKLAFQPDNGRLRQLSYEINAYLCELVERPVICRAPSGEARPWTLPANVSAFDDWKLVGMYIGLETESVDLRPQAKNHAQQGISEVALQLSNLQVVASRDLFDRRACH